MHLYLADYIGAGTDEDPFRPVGSDQPGWSSIDLRSDATRADSGQALLVLPERPDSERGLYYLGDEPDAKVSPNVRRGVEDRLRISRGVLPDAALKGDQARAGARQIIADLLTVLADGKTLCKPLVPMRDGRLRIFLAGQLWWEKAVPAGGSTITESFDQTDSTTLGPDLTWTETSGDWETASNQARPVSTANAFSEARAESDLSSADHYVQAVVSRGGSSDGNTDMRVLARFASGARTHYGVIFSQGSGAAKDAFYKRVSGSFTALNNIDDGVVFTDGDTVRLAVDGSTLTAYQNGVPVEAITDTSITTGTRTGIAGRRDSVSAYIDTFEAKDLDAEFVGSTSTAAAFASSIVIDLDAMGVGVGDDVFISAVASVGDRTFSATGFTAVDRGAAGTSSNEVTTTVLHRKLDGSEGATVTVNASNSATMSGTAAGYRYGTVGSSADNGFKDSGTTTTSIVVPGVTFTNDGFLFGAAGSWSGSGSASGITLPTGFTSRVYLSERLSNRSGDLEVSSGATGDQTFETASATFAPSIAAVIVAYEGRFATAPAGQTISLGSVSGTGSPQSLSVVNPRTYTLGTVSGTGAPQSLTVLNPRTYQLGVVEGSGAPQGLVVLNPRTYELGTVEGTGSVQGLTVLNPRTYTLGTVAATGSPQAITVKQGQRIVLGTVEGSGSVQALVVVNPRTYELGVVESRGSVQALTIEGGLSLVYEPDLQAYRLVAERGRLRRVRTRRLGVAASPREDPPGITKAL